MHRLSWTRGGKSSTLLFPDGWLALPSELSCASEATAIVAIGERALLAGGHALRPLTPGEPMVLGAQDGQQRNELCWHPEAPARLTSLDHEPTRNDKRPAAPHNLRLSTDSGQVLPLDEPLLLVGRHPSCPIRIDDPLVSAFHAALAWVPLGLRVVDLGSRNGVFVDGIRVRDLVLTTRATLRFGHTRFELLPDWTIEDRIALPSKAMHQVEVLVSRVARADAPVLIQGESGVGKDFVARRVHELRGRTGPFVPLNAAVIQPTLAASELFGHARGAFTGADHDKMGAFAAADHGTLFLDEIAELSIDVQAELLRVVEHKHVRRIGDTHETRVDVRVVVATHRDLAARVRDGLFREDLFHRLCVVPITVPPLRERLDDLVTLASAFLARQPEPRRLSDAGWTMLKAHPWPGNIRELFNVLRRACVMSDRPTIRPEDIQLNAPLARVTRVQDMIREAVVETYAVTGGSVAETARQLGMQRSAVYRHLREDRSGYRRKGRPAEVAPSAQGPERGV